MCLPHSKISLISRNALRVSMLLFFAGLTACAQQQYPAAPVVDANGNGSSSPVIYDEGQYENGSQYDTGIVYDNEPGYQGTDYTGTGNNYNFDDKYGGSAAPVTMPNSSVPAAGSDYIVSKGDTLYSISAKYGLDVQNLILHNRIAAPYTISPGQRIQIPARGKYVASRPPADITPPNYYGTEILADSPGTGGRDFAPLARGDWQWPTAGRMIAGYTSGKGGNKGINIEGRAGQPIYAAAGGKVVYTGRGLPSYGNLLIIKHDEIYLSAYAHSQAILVKEGDTVKMGQKVALLGRTGAQQEMLHFEIRRDGKPIDPLPLLPKMRY